MTIIQYVSMADTVLSTFIWLFVHCTILLATATDVGQCSGGGIVRPLAIFSSLV